MQKQAGAVSSRLGALLAWSLVNLGVSETHVLIHKMGTIGW